MYEYIAWIRVDKDPIKYIFCLVQTITHLINVLPDRYLSKRINFSVSTKQTGCNSFVEHS
jgi:hypothetical protein